MATEIVDYFMKFEYNPNTLHNDLLQFPTTLSVFLFPERFATGSTTWNRQQRRLEFNLKWNLLHPDTLFLLRFCSWAVVLAIVLPLSERGAWIPMRFSSICFPRRWKSELLCQVCTAKAVSNNLVLIFPDFPRIFFPQVISESDLFSWGSNQHGQLGKPQDISFQGIPRWVQIHPGVKLMMCWSDVIFWCFVFLEGIWLTLTGI